MTPTALNNICNWFGIQDDLSVIDTDSLEAKLIYKTLTQAYDFFPTALKIYVLGRTGAGKTTFINHFLTSGKTHMSTSGYMDCTNAIQYCRLDSNLIVFDTPGSGGNEEFENVTRVAIGLPQLSEPDLSPISSFPVFDYSQPDSRVKARVMSVQNWQHPSNLEIFSPDILFYLIAPQRQFLRDDKQFLGSILQFVADILGEQKQSSYANRIIFGLNTFYKNGEPLYTQANVDDVINGIKALYRKYYSGDPMIVSINCETGSGIKQFLDHLMKILPVEQTVNLKNFLENTRALAIGKAHKTYRRGICQIAAYVSRLPSDTNIQGVPVIETAAIAVVEYGLLVFGLKGQKDLFQSLKRLISDMVHRIKSECISVIKCSVPVTEDIEYTYLAPVDKEGRECSNHKAISGKKDFYESVLNGDDYDDCKEELFVRTKYKTGILQGIPVIRGYEEEALTAPQEYGILSINFLLGLGIGIEKALTTDPSSANIDSIVRDRSAAVSSCLDPVTNRIKVLCRDFRNGSRDELMQLLSDMIASLK